MIPNAARTLVLLASSGAVLGCNRSPLDTSTTGSAPSETPVADAGSVDAAFPPSPEPSLPITPVVPDASCDPSDAGQPTAHDAQAPEAGAPEDAAPLTCDLGACDPGQPCPDLAVDQNDLIGSIVISERQFDVSSCALVEGCIAMPGTRRLLRFDTATMNIGDADLHVGSPIGSACFTYSQCHQHFHFRGVARYTLYEQDGTTVAAVGHKQGFCLLDSYPAQASGVTAQSVVPFDCDNQGLHVGYEDVYASGIDCQWIDITDVPAGSYVLSVLVNVDHYLPESDYTNNEARVQITIPGP